MEVFSVVVLFNTIFLRGMGLVVFCVAMLFNEPLLHRTAVAVFLLLCNETLLHPTAVSVFVLDATNHFSILHLWQCLVFLW